MAEMPGSPEAGNSLDPSTSDGGSTSQDLEDCLDSPLAADFSEPPDEESSTYEEQERESQENPIQRLMLGKVPIRICGSFIKKLPVLKSFTL